MRNENKIAGGEEKPNAGLCSGLVVSGQLTSQMKTEQSVERPEVEIGTYPEPSFEAALEVVKRADIESRIAIIRELLPPIFEEFRALNPVTNDHGKYLNLEFKVHGYDDSPVESSIYFASGIHFFFEKASDVFEALNNYDPEKQRLEKIERLKSELAALEKEAA